MVTIFNRFNNNEVNNNISNNKILNAAFSSKAEDHFISDDNATTAMLDGLFWTKNTIALHQADMLEELFVKRTSMCGIGTKRVKYFLDRKASEGDTAAKILYTALKAEDKRLSSLMCSDKYRTSSFNEVENQLSGLVDLISYSKIGSFNYVDIPYSDCLLHEIGKGSLLLIDLPGDEQIGYIVLGWNDKEPNTGELKSSDRTNLTKIETAINRLYGNQIVEKYGSPATAIDAKLPNVIIVRDQKYAVTHILEPKAWCKAAYRRIAPTEKQSDNELLISNFNKDSVLAAN